MAHLELWPGGLGWGSKMEAGRGWVQIEKRMRGAGRVLHVSKIQIFSKYPILEEIFGIGGISGSPPPLAKKNPNQLSEFTILIVK